MDLVRIAIQELWAHKGRSLAAMTGVMLGVLSLVSMVVIMRGIIELTQANTRYWGGHNRIHVWGAPSTPGGKYDGFNTADLTALRQSCRTATHISPGVGVHTVLAHGSRQFQPATWGITDAARIVSNFEVDQGRFLSEGDVLGVGRTVVLGSETAGKLFEPYETVVGNQLLVNGLPFTVVGVLKKYGTEATGFEWQGFKDRLALIPLTTVQRLFHRRDVIGSFGITTTSAEQTGTLASEVSNVLARTHGNQVKVIIADFGQQLRTSADGEREANRILALIMGLTGVITLLVSAIGITNILLASVEERVREIGIRKAVGASELGIASQFLVESLCLCGGGGLLGLAFSAVGVRMALHFLIAGKLLPPDFIVTIPLNGLLTGAAACILVGLVAGIQPAIHAARLNAIEALRYE